MKVNIQEYTESLRESLLTSLFGEGDNRVVDAGQTYGYAGIAAAFDRATTKAFYRLYQAGPSLPNPGPEFQPGLLVHTPKHKSNKTKTGKKGPGPAAGSQAARDRALKAQETRRRNAAAKAAESSTGNSGVNVPVTTGKATGFGGTPVGDVAQVVSSGE